MAVKTVNTLNVVGLLKEVNLTQATSQTGRDYIRGTLTIDTGSEDAPNEVKVNVFQMADKKDKKNPGQFVKDDRFDTLLKFMTPEAIDTKVSVSGSIANNIFVDREGETIKGTQLEGGFYNIPGNGKIGNQFRVTMAITSVTMETDREGEETGSAVVKGYGYNFMGVQIPMSFYVDNEAGVEHFMNLGADPSNIIFKDVWGRIENVQLAPKTEESAFGEAFEVQSTFTRTRRVITGTEMTEREITDEVLEFFKKGKEGYNTAVASAQEYHEKRQAEQGSSTEVKATQNTKPKVGGFNF